MHEALPNGTTLSLNWYGNATLDYLLTTSPSLVFTWGMVLRTLLVRYVFHHNVESLNIGFNIYYTIICLLPLVSMQFLGRWKDMQQLWELLSSNSTYYTWRPHWSLIFYQARAVWIDMIHFLRLSLMMNNQRRH